MPKSPTRKSLPGNELLACESGGWIACRVPQPAMETDALHLISQSDQSQPGNLRFALDGRQAYLLGELRDPDGLLTRSEAHERLFADASHPADDVSQVEVSCALGETGYEWSQPEGQPGQWQAVANDPGGHRCELTATVVRGGIEVRSRLSDGETHAGEVSQVALARLFAAAHGRVRFVRFTLHGSVARAISFSAADRLDVELPDSVAAVRAACRLVWREVRALADGTVARVYLEATD